jgi:tubulin-specific chaperone A
VGRLKKEVAYYEQEVFDNEAKLKEMKEQHKNPHDIKKFEEVVGESHMMIPDSKNRLEQALTDLAAFIDSTEVEGLETDEWYVQALELVKEIHAPIKDAREDIVQETDVSNLQEGEAF